ncbi:PHD-type domain-containing protein [Mycena chlorophos]|uniref:PHD-type domain-containing protein n=1 Tax=Mycena chlorophos TaxID=658473 RepID=A0A8H6S9E9_MYCCL|nr:PHD-type domain-containing protein [Mycena chlorophos]
MAAQPVPAPTQLPVVSPSMPAQSTSSVEPRIAAFPLGRSHLPTPQSPDQLGQYLNLQGPESPLAQISHPARPVVYTIPSPLHKPMPPLQGQTQTMTPESSPYTPRHDPSRYPVMTHAIPHFNPYAHYLTPKAAPSTASPSTIVRAPPPRMATPPPSANSHPANLSSPFADKPTPASRNPYFLPRQIPIHVDDIFSSASPPKSNTPSVQTSTPPVSPPSSVAPTPVPAPAPGGEMERIRQTMLQNQLAHHQEAEARRPDYLKRGKRPLSEAGPSANGEDEREGSRRPGVGITDSPHKGRRIALFQETSDESFEESLMAGGYGRYRTADWVRTPHPLPPPGTPGAGQPGPSTIAQRVEALQAAQPPTPKDLKRLRRLNAFRSNETTNTNTEPQTPRLFPVTVEGIGRVLMDAESEERGLGDSKKGVGLGKKPVAAGGKKANNNTKPQEPSARERRAMLMAAMLEETAEKPNWPDGEFPWRLRSDERAELTKEEDRHRMKRIESFLNRDTDDEADSEGENGKDADEHEQDLLSAAEWGRIYREDQRPVPARGGRGKMVPLAADVTPDGRPNTIRRRQLFVPSDPADARAALLAKRTARAISFRKDRRHEQQPVDDDVVLCICKGKYDSDDGDVVQCDQCRTWYHLHCIGIPDVAALGPEDAEWYCMACVVVARSDSSDDGEEELVQPTFAPTEEQGTQRSSPDAPMFQALQESPVVWTKKERDVLSTPPRRTTTGSKLAGGAGALPFPSFEARDAPVTPKAPTTPAYLRPPRVWGSSDMPHSLTPGFAALDFYGDDTPFDPTSTPSRGIKFGAAFTTPKAAVSGSPSRRRDSSSRLFGAPGTLEEALRGENETRLRLATPSEREGFWSRHLRRLSAEGHGVAGVWASP